MIVLCSIVIMYKISSFGATLKEKWNNGSREEKKEIIITVQEK